MENNNSLTPSFNGKFDYDLGIALPEAFYKDKGDIKANARAFKLIHEKKENRKAVLCFHGYQGYPGEMASFAKRLYMAGFDVWVPRCPGMGTTWKDFYGSDERHWLQAALYYTKAVSDIYGVENLYLAGHSMGCAICVLCAEKTPVRKVVLFAPAIGKEILADKQRRQLKMVSHFLKRKKIEWHHDDSYHFEYEAGVDADLALGAEYWSFLTPKKLLQADNLFKAAYDALPTITAKTLIFSGGKDPLISKKTCEEVASKLKSAKLVYLEKCTHGIPYDIDLPSMDKAFSGAVDFFL